MVATRISTILVSLVVFAACSGGAPSRPAKVAVVADERLMFTEADIAEVDSVGLHFTLRDSSVARIAFTWPMEIRGPHGGPPRPSRFAVLVEGDTIIVGRMQYIESSYLPEGPLMSWPLAARRVNIFAARRPGIPAERVARIREALRLAGVPEE